MSRAADSGDDDADEGVGLTVEEAFERFDRVLSVGYSGSGSEPRVHDADVECRYVPDSAEPVERHEIPLSSAVCRRCDPTVSIPKDDQRGRSPIEGRRICGCMGCTDEAFVIVDHPDHGRRAVCPGHRADHDVVEEVGG